MKAPVSKRTKYKEKFRLPEPVYCQECYVVDVTLSDPEMEYVCAACWAILHERHRKDKK
jgi:ribosomal protein S27E